VVDAVKGFGASFVAIDSLNAYLQAMPGQSFLLLHMHELLTFLNHQSVTTMLIVGQHGVVGTMRSELDLSYLSDAVLLYKFFETDGAVIPGQSYLQFDETFDPGTGFHVYRMAPGSHSQPHEHTCHESFYVIEGDSVVDVWPISARGYHEHRITPSS